MGNPLLPESLRNSFHFLDLCLEQIPEIVSLSEQRENPFTDWEPASGPYTNYGYPHFFFGNRKKDTSRTWISSFFEVYLGGWGPGEVRAEEAGTQGGPTVG